MKNQEIILSHLRNALNESYETAWTPELSNLRKVLVEQIEMIKKGMVK